MTFAEKIAAQAGLVRSHVMTANDASSASGNEVGNDIISFINDGEGAPTDSVFDPSVIASGQPSLKFIIASQSGSGSSGQWSMRFSSDNSVQFDSGTFYVQFMQKFDRYMLEHTFAGGGGWKQSMVGEADGAGCGPGNTTSPPCASSCSYIEVVVQNTTQYGFPQMYNACGFYTPFQVGGIDGGSDVDMQPHQGLGPLTGGPSTYCSFQDRPSQGGTFQGCYKYSEGFASPSDQTTQWGTFTYGITLGTIVGDFWTNCNIKLWVSWGGATATKVIDYDTNLRCGGKKFGRLWLMPYHTGKDITEVHTETYVWYANPIVATSPIPLETTEVSTDKLAMVLR